MKKTTLCLLLKDNEILLAMKKRGFGAGKWNGVGGKVDKGETVRAATARELNEEVGVTVREEHLEDVGNIKFHFKGKPDWDQHVHIFVARNWNGEPSESEEMIPKWYKLNDIPFDSMWSDDRHWLPLVLAGKKIEGEFHFNEDGNEFTDFNVREI